MATIKKMAKKAVPKVKEEPKQIILTEEQYDEMVSLGWEINSISRQLKSICVAEENTDREVIFEAGILQTKLDKAFETLNNLTTIINPNKYEWGDEDENDYDKGYN
jgi:hypothetical protein